MEFSLEAFFPVFCPFYEIMNLAYDWDGTKKERYLVGLRGLQKMGVGYNGSLGSEYGKQERRRFEYSLLVNDLDMEMTMQQR